MSMPGERCVSWREGVRMDMAFARSRDRRARTVATRADGVRLAVLVFGKLDPIPHDLAHFLVEVTGGCATVSGGAWRAERSLGAWR